MESRTIETRVTLIRRPCTNEYCSDGVVNECTGHDWSPKFGGGPVFEETECTDCDGRGFIEHTAEMWNALDLEAQLDELRHEMAQDERRFEETVAGLRNTVAAQESQIRTLTVLVATREESNFRLETELTVTRETVAKRDTTITTLREQLAAALDEVARLRGVEVRRAS